MIETDLHGEECNLGDKCYFHRGECGLDMVILPIIREDITQDG